MKPVRTLAQARALVRAAGLVGIFSNDGGKMVSLWDVVDLPGRQPGERGWGQKVTSIWRWKDELPARWPDEVFYGKIPGGLAVLMSLDRLEIHYRDTHRSLTACSELSRRIAERLRFDPATSRELRRDLGLADKAERGRFDRALLELQVTLNITRRNSLADRHDTWVLFREQYLGVVRRHEDG